MARFITSSSSQILDLSAQSSTQTKNEAIIGGVLALPETIIILSGMVAAMNLGRLAAPAAGIEEQTRQ
jgi:hypothetical protein